MIRKCVFLRGVGFAVACGTVLAACTSPAKDDEGDFVAVTDITGVPASVPVGERVDLWEAEVVPNTATNKTILWRVKTPGAGVTVIANNGFTPTSAGTLVVTAAISKGKTSSQDYTKDFTISVGAPSCR